MSKKREIELEKRLEEAEKLILDYAYLAEQAMHQANNDGAEYDILAELKDCQDYFKKYKN